MNKIYIIINKESEDAELMMEIIKDINNYEIYYESSQIPNADQDEINHYICFAFNIDDKDECKEFLRLCKENKCEMEYINIQLRIKHEASKI
jgi:hypothetical protein